jgi:acetyl esterase/lipase
MKRGSVGALLLVIGCWCGASAADPSISADVIYGHKDGMALTYDVFAPEKANGAGVVYMVSGGWFSVWREPAQQMTWFEPLLNEGFTVFAVRHGSAPRFKVPDAVSDVRAAVRHIRNHAATYGVDPGRLGVWGGSAGGHLSLMLGLDPEDGPVSAGEGPRQIAPRYAVDAGDDGRLAAVVAFYPPVDLRTRVGPSERFPALDFPKDAAAAISPILFVDAGDPPTLLVHGDADELVPLADSETMNAALEKAGVTHDLQVIEGGVHGFRDPERRARAMRAMVDWFKKYLVR